MPPARSTRRPARLVRRLRAAQASLAEWEDSLRALAVGPAPDSPHSAAELLSIVNQAKLALNQLLAEVDADVAAEAAAPANSAAAAAKRPTRTSSLGDASRVCVKACRACGRALGAAFGEAQRAADAAAANILYGSLRALEKQIWMLDPRQ